MKQTICLLAFCLPLTVTKAQTTNTFKFDFTPGKVAVGYTQVLPTTLYNAQTGYGFDRSSVVNVVNTNSKAALQDGYITSSKPFFFSVKLPEGNYNVKVVLGDAQGTSATTIKAECRRLMVEKVETAKGKFATAAFTVHVKDSIIRKPEGNNKVRLKPRESAYLHWDDKLTLEFNNAAPKVASIEVSPATNIPTVFLAGNSTVVDQAEEPWAAWGQMFPLFFQPGKVAIANYAESGETLKAFKGERRLEKIWSLARPGDYLFIEFTHNDQKPGGNYLEPFTTYKQTEKEWIAEARKRGVIPVLVTSMHRRNFDSTGHIINTLKEYPDALRQTAQEEKVALIDLNAMSKTLYEVWGPEASKKAFVHYPANAFPNQTNALQDNTHFNSYGAYELAKCVVEGLKKTDLPLVKLLKPDLPVFNPANPDDVANFNLPPSPYIPTVKPDGN
jgi:lysophospholipase L1-like esterase